MTCGVSPTGRTDSCYLRARVVLLDTSFLPAPLKTVADSEGSHDMWLLFQVKWRPSPGRKVALHQRKAIYNRR